MMTRALIAGAVMATAMAAHALNRDYCASLGDDSQQPWADAPEWQRDSAIKGVEFHLANPDASASASHDSWMAQKVAEGWVYGEVKDPDKKTHPCIVEFGKLPPEQQLKDVLFKAQVHAVYPLLEASSAEIDRLTNNGSGGIDPDFAAGLDENDTAQLATRVATLEDQVETLTLERDEAREKLEAAEKKLAAKARQVKVKDAEGKPRKFGIEPVSEAVAGGMDKARRDELHASLQQADSVEIVQIDAKGKEIPGSTPFHVSGDVWKDHAIGLMLDQPAEFRGSDVSYQLAGFALLIDGKHVATQIRSDPLVVNPGQQVKLVNDIAF